MKKLVFIMACAAAFTVLCCGCGEKKYKIEYDGFVSEYVTARSAYKAGETVTLYYDLIATDTDYSFYLDGEPLRYDYSDEHGFILTFVMPEHDVKLECSMKNSMEYDGGEYFE